MKGPLCSRNFECVFFNPYNNHTQELLAPSHLYGGLEILSDLPKMAKLVNGGVGIHDLEAKPLSFSYDRCFDTDSGQCFSMTTPYLRAVKSQSLDWGLDLGSFQKYSRWHSSLVSGEWPSDTCIWVKAGLILVVKCTINLCHPWRSLGGGHDNPLQYSCLGNLMDRGAWWATVWVCKELATAEWLNSCSSSLPLSMSYEQLQQSPVAS